jgi:hypothetical protein
MRPQSKRKLIAGLISAAGAAVLALGSLTAGAFAAPNPGPGDGPQTANVPYVAWVGEHVRLVACDPSINADGYANIQFANFQVEDWSGYQFQPPTPDGDAGNNLGEIFDPGPAAFFASSEPAHRIGEGESEGCVATDYKSLNPGLSRIRLDVRNWSTHEIVFSHQFLVIWLTVNTPTLAEAGTERNINADGSPGENVIQSQANPSDLANYLGDPAGNGKFTPSPFPGTPATKGQNTGLVQIKVTGSFPVVGESPLSNILPGGTGSEPGKDLYTLPDDWATLAGVLASSSEETEPPGTNPSLWDIHGTAIEGTTSNEAEPLNDALSADFFRPAFGDNTSGATATVGPFDPQAANETLLSDGRLNADDTPMPAMRIDVTLAGNEGGSSLGGVGQIAGASKAVVYSHDLTGNAAAGGNLYNPYYGAYIPATDRPVAEASGVTGPSPGGDFPGFLNKHPEPYTFWNSVRNGNYLSPESTGCLRSTGVQPSEYQTPEGYRSETFYTDERGEVYLTYKPGDGFYLNHFPVFAGNEGESETGKIIKNADGGCDLKGLFEQTIGESSISATAVYPYEPVDYPAVKTATPLVKTVRSLWEKEWFQFPKGPGANEQSIRIVVAKAQDINGYPFVGETVCFVAPNGGTLSHFPGETVEDAKGVLGFGEDSVTVGPSTIVHPEGKEGKLCETTNSNGLAAIEVTNSTLKEVDLNVEYVEEGIIRDHAVSFITEAEEKAAKEKAAKEAEEKKKAEEKAAAEKKNHEEEVAKETQRREEEAAKKKTREEEEAAKTKAREAEEAANTKAREEAEAAEKAKLAEEVAKKEKTAEEAKAKEEATKKSNEEAAAAEKKKNEEAAAAEKKANEEAAATEKKANEEAAAAEKKKNEEEVAKLAKAAAATTSGATTTSSSSAPLLFTPVPNTLPSSNTVGGARKASKSKGKKGHKATKKKGKKKGKKSAKKK